jgi:hypothetical protein
MPNEDGSFAVPDVPAGTYRVSITGLPDTVFFESVRYEARSLADLTFVLEKDAGPLELQINAPSGTVQGTVRNARNALVPNAQVVLIPSMGRRSNPEVFRVAATDQNGRFTIHGIAPDDYQVLAWEKVTAGAYQNPDFLRPYESRAAKVTVTRGSVNDLNLSVITEQ